ncbi:hypothetical protein AMATHDRAFT_55942 [Amanita thiersii Skay4041]|uniref:Putative gamma-glutamylcyclotransferase n=1 Tax=Amanita thiersii Skay4041 TaxID=703135 RepID=A0A2A9NYJ6_9AGAR|nr:hypothetical protein AMATHDRAFT_55942 [Amanita thiersii Skay4041]
MHPKILKKVIQNDGKHLTVCPALLMEYTRHRVKYEDYPGIIPYEKAKRVLNNGEVKPEERCVKGTLVAGLLAGELEQLDLFEGEEYERVAVSVYKLANWTPLEGDIDVGFVEGIMSVGMTHVHGVTGEVVEAETYVFLDEQGLEGRLWSFREFVRTSAWKWYGAAVKGGEEGDVAGEEKGGGTSVVDRRLAGTRTPSPCPHP